MTPNPMKVVYPPPFPIRWFLQATGYKAITMPWQTVYMLVDPTQNEGLLSHEEIHVQQIRRFGPWKFAVLYLWYLVTRGYEDHPFEIEARRSGFR